MFSTNPNYAKLKTNLRLSMARLKLLQKKKTELTEKSRKEIADFLATGKIDRAKIRVEYIIREDYLVEAMELVEMYCDLLLTRFGMIVNMKELDDGIAEAVASLIWVAPRLQSDCQELKIVSDMLSLKFGPQFAESCRSDTNKHLSKHLKHKLAISAPPKILAEKYIIEIAKTYNVPYEPDQNIMNADNGPLIDFTDRNNFFGPPAPGFVGYPMMPPGLPLLNYPMVDNLGAPTAPPEASTFSYNIPPLDNKEVNTDLHSVISDCDNATAEMHNNEATTDIDNKIQNEQSNKPTQDAKFIYSNFNIQDLPSIPSGSVNNATGSNESAGPADDMDFDDLTKRFNALRNKR